MSERLDTIVGIPSARPAVPAPAAMIPGLRSTGVATYEVKRPWWIKHTPAKHVGWAAGGALGTVIVAAHVIVTALGGAM